MFKVGIGYDVHKFEDKRELIIGGVNIPHHRGLDGHSDADVLIHAIMDSLLGPSGLGDIGHLFPDTDMKYKNISSINLMEIVKENLHKKNIKINNIDCVVMAEKPKMAPHIPQMQKNIAQALEIDERNITIKATTTEKLGFVGREEGIAAQAVALIEFSL